MQVGISIDPRDPETMRACSRRAEATAVDLLAVADSQSRMPEAFSSLALVAAHTETPTVGVVAANPRTRHRTVTASGIATIDAISGGRAMVAMATGHSAVRGTDLEPASLDELGAAVTDVRSLLRGEEIRLVDQPVTVGWADSEAPVFLAGQGPSTLARGGMIADGVIYGGWNTPERVTWAADQVERGLDRAGRTFDDVEFWVTGACEVADSRARAIENLRNVLATSATIAVKGSRHQVPDHLADAFERVSDAYRPEYHLDYDTPHNAALLDDSELKGYLADNWAFAGTDAQVIDQIEGLDEDRVDGVLLLLRVPDPAATIARLGDRVVPTLTGR